MHSVITVVLSAKRLASHGEDVVAALADILAPYYENTLDERYLAFQDEEDAHRAEYETQTAEQIRTPGGELLWPWNERFRVPRTCGTGSDTHAVPPDCERVMVPFKQLYRSFEIFCAEYHGQSRDPKTGRVGHWHNPNAKWDWYMVGGRWSGLFPLKPGRVPVLGRPGVFGNATPEQCGDIATLDDIDFDRAAQIGRERAEEFFADYEEWLCGKQFPVGESPRSQALRLGLVRVERGAAEPAADEVAFSWSRYRPPTDEAHTWTDIAKRIGWDAFLEQYGQSFSPLATTAALDDEGWHEPASPAEKPAFDREFVSRFIKTRAPDDVLVCVDCHI